METKTLKYFAYGSNLCLTQLNERLRKEISPFKVVFMKDRELFFPRKSETQGGGVASFRKSKNKRLWGALFEVLESDLKELDKAEGVERRCYQRKKVGVYDKCEKEYDAITYKAIIVGEFPPSKRYMKKIISGANQCELPPCYITYLETIKTED